MSCSISQTNKFTLGKNLQNKAVRGSSVCVTSIIIINLKEIQVNRTLKSDIFQRKMFCLHLPQLICSKIKFLSRLNYLNDSIYHILLQVLAHGEQVFPRVKEKCSLKVWFASEDINSLEELTGRFKRLKENVGFIANRVTAVQAGLDSWQAEQINRKLYYLSFLSIIFLPLSVITGG